MVLRQGIEFLGQIECDYGDATAGLEEHVLLEGVIIRSHVLFLVRRTRGERNIKVGKNWRSEKKQSAAGSSCRRRQRDYEQYSQNLRIPTLIVTTGALPK